MTSVFSMTIGYWLWKKTRHVEAVKILSGHAASYDGFEDPIGPNWIFTGSSRVPANRSFPTWFVDNFCIAGNFDYHFESIEVKHETLNRLTNVVNLEVVSFDRCELPTTWIDSLASVKSLKHLTLISTIFPTKRLPRELRNLRQLHSLTIDVSCLDFGNDSLELLAQMFREMKTLRQLTVVCEQPDKLAVLLVEMRWCDVEVVGVDTISGN